MMTGGDVISRLCDELRRGGVGIMFDTNALWQNSRFANLCDDINRLNARRPDLPPIKLSVSAPAHAEKLFDLRQQRRSSYDESIILEGMKSKGLSVEPYTENHARHFAGLLGKRFETANAWRAHKRQRYLLSLGLPKNHDVPGTGKECAATIDWVIAAHADAEQRWLITDDQGEEFEGLARRVRLEELERALAELLAEAQIETGESGEVQG